MGYIGLLLFILFYFFATIGNFLFGGNDPENFGNLGTALMTLFQILTLEGWVEIMEAQQGSFFVPIYFIIFILLGTAIVLNLFIGVIMTGFEETNKELRSEKKSDSPRITGKDKLQAEVEEINNQIDQIKARLSKLVDSKNGENTN